MLNCIRVCETRSTETRLTRVLMRTLSSISIFLFRAFELRISNCFFFQAKFLFFFFFVYKSTWKIVRPSTIEIEIFLPLLNSFYLLFIKKKFLKKKKENSDNFIIHNARLIIRRKVCTLRLTIKRLDFNIIIKQ